MASEDDIYFRELLDEIRANRDYRSADSKVKAEALVDALTGLLLLPLPMVWLKLSADVPVELVRLLTA